MAVGRPAPLSDRERQVVALVADGCPLKDVAVRLDISIGSAKTYAKRARVKLGAKSMPHLCYLLALSSNGGQDVA